MGSDGWTGIAAAAGATVVAVARTYVIFGSTSTDAGRLLTRTAAVVDSPRQSTAQPASMEKWAMRCTDVSGLAENSGLGFKCTLRLAMVSRLLRLLQATPFFKLGRIYSKVRANGRSTYTSFAFYYDFLPTVNANTKGQNYWT